MKSVIRFHDFPTQIRRLRTVCTAIRFVLRTSAGRANTKNLQVMIDVPIMQMRHRFVNPLLKPRYLDFHGASAYTADDMMVVLPIRALTVERLAIDVNDVDLPTLDHQFQITVHGRGPYFEIATLQLLDHLPCGDETRHILQSPRDEQPRPGDTLPCTPLNIPHSQCPRTQFPIYSANAFHTHTAYATRQFPLC